MMSPIFLCIPWRELDQAVHEVRGVGSYLSPGVRIDGFQGIDHGFSVSQVDVVPQLDEVVDLHVEVQILPSFPLLADVIICCRCIHKATHRFQLLSQLQEKGLHLSNEC